MQASTTIGPAKGKKELSALLDILSMCFNFTREEGDRYSEIVGEKNYRVIRSDKTIVGGCALLPMGQYFGGKSVKMMGVAAVGISPEHRGQRFAGALMAEAIREMHLHGWPISALYPATLPLYRSVGYEQAGHRFEIRIPAKPLLMKSRESAIELRRIESADEAEIEAVYRKRAAMSAGMLDRSRFIWFRVRHPRRMTARGFLARNTQTKAIEGYTYYVQKESADAPYSIHVSDLVALTPEAGRQLLTFLANHRSMTDQIILTGSPDDPMLKLIPERNYTARLLDHWMVRIVDVGAALKARGYAPGIHGEVHLNVDDDLIADNNGRYVLEVGSGRAEVSSGGRGDIKIDIRGLAALYTGHMSPHELMLTGQLSLSSRVKNAASTLNAAAGVFAGPTPWLGDMF